ncbi:MAG: thiamine phosphate synthase [Acidobacteriaceae bacterium]
MLYAITDRRPCAGNEADARARLVELAGVWAANGAAFIQLREKDLSARDQVELARAMRRAIHSAMPHGMAVPRLLVNGRVDVALAAGADGVHLPAGPDALTAEQVRSIFSSAGCSQPPVISVACHTLEEVKMARQQSPDCILFAPVFEKVVHEKEFPFGARQNPDNTQRISGTGLALLEQACRAAAPVPVFALGGVTADNAADCIRAGAAGVAAIRLMQGPPSVWQHLA